MVGCRDEGQRRCGAQGPIEKACYIQDERIVRLQRDIAFLVVTELRNIERVGRDVHEPTRNARDDSCGLNPGFGGAAANARGNAHLANQRRSTKTCETRLASARLASNEREDQA